MIPIGGGRFVRPTCDACGRELWSFELGWGFCGACSDKPCPVGELVGERHTFSGSGVMVAWEVLGDPRDIVEVCEECAEADRLPMTFERAKWLIQQEAESLATIPPQGFRWELIRDAVASEIVGEIAEAERLRALAVWSLEQFDWLRGGSPS